MERRAFEFGVAGVAEADEEAAFSAALARALAFHYGLERVDVGPAEIIQPGCVLTFSATSMRPAYSGTDGTSKTCA